MALTADDHLVLAVAQVVHVDEGHLVEGQHGPLPHPAQDDGVQLRVVVHQAAIHLHPQQVGGEAQLTDRRGKLARLVGGGLTGLP